MRNYGMFFHGNRLSLRIGNQPWFTFAAASGSWGGELPYTTRKKRESKSTLNIGALKSSTVA